MEITEIQSTFTETLNVTRCIEVLNLSKLEIKDNFWEKDAFRHGVEHYEWTAYVHTLKTLLRAAVSKGGQLKQQYKYASGQSDGRLYVKQGGVQSMQHNIRNFLCGEFYYDIDLVNCHCSILLHVCKYESLQSTLLEEYVNDRERILAENNLSKRDILVAMYSDTNRLKKDNEWYNCFIYELKNIKKVLIPIIREMGVTTDNAKNPESSILSRHLCKLESAILQEAIRYFGKHAEVPMFDGVMVRRAFCPPEELTGHLMSLNNQLSEKYHGCIMFLSKSTECDIVLPVVDNSAKEYEAAKLLFEEEHFLTLNPFIFWKRNRTADAGFEFNQLRPEEFKLVCKEHQIIDYKANGDMKVTDIFDTWMRDKTKKCFDKIDFIPYGKIPVCPSYIYNTFDGFHASTLMENYEPVDVSNFRKMIWNMCDQNQVMNDYIISFLAHMFQFPHKLPEQTVVFKAWTGTGKDTLVRTLQSLMGTKYVGITTEPDHIFGQFNETLKTKICVFLNEMEGRHGVDYQEKMKGHSTATHNRVNAKFEKPIIESNRARLFVNSNADNPVNVQMNDRRLVICQSGYGLVANTKDPVHAKEVRAFWNQYYQDLRSNNWLASLYHYLYEEVDLSEWDAWNVPGSVARSLMRSKNINPVYHYLQTIIETTQMKDMGFSSTNGGAYFIKWKQFFIGYKNWLECNYPDLDYKVKDITVKGKLTSMTKGCFEEKQLTYTNSNGEKRSRDRNAVFDFTLIGEFLANFVYTEDEDPNSQDLGQVDTSVSAYAPGFVV